jgi:hypothetical protein
MGRIFSARNNRIFFSPSRTPGPARKMLRSTRVSPLLVSRTTFLSARGVRTHLQSASAPPFRGSLHWRAPPHPSLAPSPAGERPPLPGSSASAAPPQVPYPAGERATPLGLLCQLCAATLGFPLQRRACYPSRAPLPSSRHPNPGASPFFKRVSSAFIEGKSLFSTI